tara:strand:- start:604 stop:768 length:165 start_codon:yes stop_codon:yes gene_type:complete
MYPTLRGYACFALHAYPLDYVEYYPSVGRARRRAEELRTPDFRIQIVLIVPITA